MTHSQGEPPGDLDLWLLAGQSNMAGSGSGGAYESPSEQVWLCNLRDQWEIAREPFLADRYEATDSAFALMRSEMTLAAADPDYRRRRGERYGEDLRRHESGGGLGLAFGKAIAAFTGRPVGLVFCAKGDTRMNEWAPDWSGSPCMALYAATWRRVRAVGRPLTGVLWYQGESDTFDHQGHVYAEKMRELVGALRRDLRQPELPWFYVQIGNCVMQTEEELPEWNLVQETQRRLEAELAPDGMCTAVDLPLRDGIHLSTRAQQRLGRRLARLVRRGLYGDPSVETGPRPTSVTRDPEDDCQLRIGYEGVNGSLQPAERVAGFSVLAPGGERNLVCAALVEPAEPHTVLVRTYCPLAAGSALWYGRGLTAFCNLADEADMGAPMFGPRPIPD